MKTLAETSAVTFSGCLPCGLLSQNTLTVRINNISRIVEIDNRSDFRVELPVELRRGENVSLQIESAQSRSGAEAELNSDDRQLAFYLKEIAFHSEPQQG